MKNAKRYLALLTAATMALAPVTAGATTLNSNGVLENDRSTAPAVASVVLQTTADDTLSFTIDPEDLLNEVNPDVYPSADGVYFTQILTKGAIKKVNADGKEIATLGAVDMDPASATALSMITAAVLESDDNGNITAVTDAAFKGTTDGAYYLWVPDETSSLGAGKYIHLDGNAIKKYFKNNDTTGAATSAAFKAVGLKDSACDGEVYVVSEGALGAVGTYDPSDYVDYVPTTDGTNAKVTALRTDKMLCDVDTGEFITTTDNLVVSGIKAVNTNKSEAIKVTNKAADDWTVTVKATATSLGSLKLDMANTDFGSKTAAAATFTLAEADTAHTTTAATSAAITGSGVGFTISFDLDGVGKASNRYQGEEDTEGTGGHNYYQYAISAAKTPAYDSAYFWIEGDSNQLANFSDDDAKKEAKANWDAYADEMNQNNRPTFKLVYTIKKTGEEMPATTDGGTFKASWNSYYGEYVVKSSDTKLTKDDKVLALYYSTDKENWNQAPSVSSYVTVDEWGTLHMNFKVNGVGIQYWKLIIGDKHYIIEMW